MSKQVGGMRTVTEVCRELGISKRTFCSLIHKLGALNEADIQRMKDLAEENARFTQMYLDQAVTRLPHRNE